MTVSAWAVKHMGYDPLVLPWQTTIMDALGEPGGGDVDLMGPAQAGKSEIGLAWWGWSIDQSPADFIICQPDKTMMQDFVVRRLAPMIKKVEVLADSLLEMPGADNIFTKQFAGMISAHIWPVAAQFRARPVPRGWLDDYDQIPEDIEGQGSAHKLMDGRQTWFEGSKRTFSSSSPAREDGSGIEARVRGGTDERLHPECPSCGERFEIRFDKHLQYPKGTPEEAQAGARLHCPVNGCILKPESKRAMLQSLARLPDKGFIPHNPGAQRRSFAVDGTMNITSWGELAKALREAEVAWETRQDETEMRAVHNTRGGRNYRSQNAGEKALGADDLVGRIEAAWQMGTVPPGAQVLTASVDVQSNRFEVLVTAWGVGLECWLVDRFDIGTLEDGRTLIDPARWLEHWAVLQTRVLQKTYPLANDPTQSVPIMAMAVDTGGEAGVSQNAANWYRAAIRMGVSRDRIALVKGTSNVKQLRLVQATWLDAKKKGGPDKRGVRLWTLNVHSLKDVLDARLRRTEPGAGYIHIPSGFQRHWLEELTAEQKSKGKWVQMRPRNETLDLYNYAYAALLRPGMAGTRGDMDWVPDAFRVPEQDFEAPALIAAAAPAPRAAPQRLVQQMPQPTQPDWVGAGDSWL